MIIEITEDGLTYLYYVDAPKSFVSEAIDQSNSFQELVGHLMKGGYAVNVFTPTVSVDFDSIKLRMKGY